MRIYVARRDQRKALYLPMGGTKDNPSLMFLLPKMDKSQLDEFVRKELAKQGITSPEEVNAIISKAEQEYEQRIKTQEAQTEIKRLLKIRADGGKIMQVGHRKWKQAFYPAVEKK